MFDVFRKGHSRIVPTFPIDGGTIRRNPFKNPYFSHICCADGFGEAIFSVIWGTFGAKTVFKTHLLTIEKGQFLLCRCHRRKRCLFSNPPETAKNPTTLQQIRNRVAIFWERAVPPKGFGQTGNYLFPFSFFLLNCFIRERSFEIATPAA